MKFLVNGDMWLHFGALLAITFGAADLWYFHQLSHDAELLFLVGGFAGLGLKIANGTASLLQQVVESQAAQAAAQPKPIPAPLEGDKAA